VAHCCLGIFYGLASTSGPPDNQWQESEDGANCDGGCNARDCRT
jgi:hypothetical protein